MNNLTAFLTGVTSGGLTCVAVQGGLLAAVLAKQHASDEGVLPRWQQLLLPTAGFLIAKIVIYTVLGMLLGFLGEEIALSVPMQAWLQGVAALFMIVTGIRILQPHRWAWLHVNPPVSIRRFIRHSAKSELLFAPILLGTLTVFLPCGSTLAIEAAALASRSSIQGAALLFFFVLGTAPLFFLVGILAKGSALMRRRLSFITAAIVIGVGIISFNAALNLVDAPFSTQQLFGRFAQSQRPLDTAITTRPVLDVLYNGYRPRFLTVPAGKPISLQLKASAELSCTNFFLIPKLGIQRQLTAGTITNLLVTFPSAGDYTFTCGMGMFTGTIRAI